MHTAIKTPSLNRIQKGLAATDLESCVLVQGYINSTIMFTNFTHTILLCISNIIIVLHVNRKPILECWAHPKGAFQILDDSIVDIILKMVL